MSLTGEEGTEEHSAEVRAPARPGAPPARRTPQHPQARGGSVQQGVAARLEGAPSVCDEQRPQEDPGDQGGARHRSSGVHQHHQQLLSRGDRQVSPPTSFC